MSRNGAGIYTLPEPPFVIDTAISPTPVNSNYSDIATALTGSVAADGQTPMTGSLVGTTAAFSGVVTAADGEFVQQVVNNSQFERVKPTVFGGNFAQVFPGGNMIQSGYLANVAPSQTITFPYAFAILSAVSVTAYSPVGNLVSVQSPTTTNFVLKANGAGGGINAFWMATGTRT